MLLKKQLVAYCEKQFKLMRLPFFSAYKEFLNHYFHRFKEKGCSVDDLGYYSDVALAHFNQLLKHNTGKTIVDVADISVQRDYVFNYTRILISAPDEPFLVESLRNALIRHGCQIVQNNLMPNFEVEKTAKKVTLTPVESGGSSFIWMDVENFGDASNTEIKEVLLDVLRDIRIVVRDWRRMQGCLRNIMYSWRDTPETIVEAERLQTYIAFMEWIQQYFTFLSYHGFRYSKKKKIALKDKWGLATKKGSIAYNIDLKEFPKQLEDDICPLVLITQTSDRSSIHRDTYKDLLVLRVYSPGKKHWIEEHYFTGLLTADAFVSDPSVIPLLSEKYQQALTIPHLRDRYSLRRMEYILKSLPREELFRADVRYLADMAYNTLLIQGMKVTRLFIRQDVCKQYYSVIIYIPRSIFTTRIRSNIEHYLAETLQSLDLQYTPYIADGVLTRLYFNVLVDPKNKIEVSVEKMQADLEALCVSWDGALYDQLCQSFGQKKGYLLTKKYLNELSDQYRNTYVAEIAALDIESLEKLSVKHPIALRIEESEGVVSFRLFQYNTGQEVSLREVFPLLSHYGFCVKSEKNFEEKVEDSLYHVSEYRCELKYESVVSLEDIKEELSRAIRVSLESKEKTDDFCNLLVISGIRMQEIDVVRALCTYLHQIKFPLSIQRMSSFFIEYPTFAQSVMRYFNAKFQPKIVKRDTFIKRYEKELLAYTDSVKTSDDERIVREVINVLKALLRTNYNLNGREALILKISSGMIESIPKPAPLYEFFVYSRRLIGTHLRFSKVARGGIRNSDRLDDVRHEVLELAKTQRLKNTLIVPDGAKGGFVCRLSSEDMAVEVLTCYKIFIRSMLSLTDNYVNGKVVRNNHLVSYDDEDPYFVVAADKGTATFSSYANAISIEENYWLGDAFASGGEHGYDHKKMGITAKGAWESVKWHFLSKNHNVYEIPFTVVGIGDMAGDVFGNGLLLSDKIQLVAAFNHASIFIDPEPNEKTSYQERLRMFQLPRSTWEDYNASKISQGGGVFSRSEKYIALTAPMKKLFSTTKAKMEPNEMIQEILKLPVDLIWNGGIGVYVKSSRETHYEVSDFHNDACRVDACELRAAVVGEGGNNGFTQLGRVEYSQSGGLINTDFIDNSAGVNTSDVEVNFKILFQAMIAKKVITLPKRNHLLSKMAHHVSDQVLRNNFLQNVQINLTSIDARKNPNYYIQFIESLETSGLLNRDIEKIPSKRELEARKKQLEILTRPEIAVLLSYSKIALYDAISSLGLGKHPLAHHFLLSYFPKTIRTKYINHIEHHLLRDELVATELTNHMVGEVGILFMPQLCDECNVMPDQVVMAYLVVRTALGLEDIYETLYQNVSKVDQITFLYLLGSLQRAIYKSCRRLIRYQDMSKIDKLLKDFGQVAELPSLLDQFPKKYSQRMYKTQKALIDVGIPEDAANKICESRYFYQRFGIQDVVNKSGFLPEQVVQVYYQVAHKVGFHKVKEKLLAADLRSRWDIIQRAAVDDDLGYILELLTLAVLKYSDKHQHAPNKALDAWAKDHKDTHSEIKNAFSEIVEMDQVDLSAFLVAIHRIKSRIGY